MTLPLVIINPESAGGATRDAWPRIASDLRSHFGRSVWSLLNEPGRELNSLPMQLESRSN